MAAIIFLFGLDIRMKKITLLAMAMIILNCVGCGAEPECTIGQRICVNNVSKTCYEGHWRIVECANAAPVCDEKLGCIPIPQICGNEMIEGTEVCDGSNLGGKTCGDMFAGLVGTLKCHECTFDTSECRAPGCAENTRRCGESGVEICQNGEWNTSQVCTASEKCDSVKATCIPYVPCDAPGVSCVENILSICAGGQLFETECQENQVCSVTHAKCEPKICDEGARRCEDATAQICIYNGWVDAIDCALSGMICDNTHGGCAAKCNEGADVCNVENSAIISCQNGVQKITACGEKNRCALDDDGKPVCEPWVCDEGIECKGANPNSTIKMLKVCENNVLVKKETCKESDGVVCSVTEAACVPLVCKAGDIECQTVGDVSNIAQCENNAWKLTPCEGQNVCTVDIEGDGNFSCAQKVCHEGYACENNDSINCWGNNIVSRTPCAGGCDPTTGRCK